MLLVIVVSAFAVAGAVGVYMWASRDLPGFKKIADYKPPLVTTVYAKDGEILGYLYREKRFLVRLEDMNPMLPKAFLAAEDKSFYEHEGVDPVAILRATIKNIKAGQNVQGGSTITQQIIKRILLTPERKYKRKLKEAILAYRLENYLSKDEILTIYLNQIYLGAKAYGVEAAARTYFGKHVRDLTLAECAVLAGLPPAPSRYNPYRHPEAAKTRQLYVLDRMLELNWITKAEYDQAKDEPLKYESMEDVSWKVGPYYLEEVRRWLVDYLSKENLEKQGITLERYGEDAVYESGLHVYTAMDIDHQRAAEKAVHDGLVASSKRRGWQGPLENLTSQKDIENFLRKESVTPGLVASGEWFKVLVTKVENKGAHVRMGQYKGYIPVSTMGWCRKPNPKLAPEQVAKITNANKVLNPGDVVLAKWLQPESKVKVSQTGEEQEEDTAPAVPDMSGEVQLSLEQHPKVQGALVSIEPPTGEVRAMVGGYSFEDSQFNRATQAYRQPGSSFKPIVYSAAMDNGFTPGSVVVDAPIVIRYGKKVWKPANFSHKFFGPTLLRTALAKSRNLVTIRIAQRIGIRKVIERAKAMGLTPEFPPYLPICLGAVAVTPMNLCQAYTAFPRGGSTIEPQLVLTVMGPWGEPVYKNEPKVTNAISPQNAFIMSKLLEEVVNGGTATRAKKLGRPLAGKTGTTNEERDAWFMGFTPYLLTGVYVGFDQIRPMGRFETGSRAALPIWLEYRMAIENKYPEEDFKQPEGVVFRQVTFADRQSDGSLRSGTYNLPFMTHVSQHLQGPENAEETAEEYYGSEEAALDAIEQNIIDSTQGAPEEEPKGKEEDLFKQLF